MTVTAFSPEIFEDYKYRHVAAGKAILQFLNDCGEDCAVILDFDDPEEEFDYLFTGTSFFLRFDEDTITVLDYNIETGEETYFETFSAPEINKATHCLLTLVNEANQSS